MQRPLNLKILCFLYKTLFFVYNIFQEVVMMFDNNNKNNNNNQNNNQNNSNNNRNNNNQNNNTRNTDNGTNL